MSTPSSYRRQDGCHTCELCFIRAEYDDQDRYFCQFDAVPRPPCGSVAMAEGEHWPNYENVGDDNDPFVTAMNAWDAWAEKHEVAHDGICDHFRKEPPCKT
jgi:hypothetical protein